MSQGQISLYRAYMGIIRDLIKGLLGVSWDSMGGLPLTIKLHKQGQIDASVWGSFATGAAMFSKQKTKFLSDEASMCSHCGGVDSQRHRLFECPHYNTCRVGLPMDILRDLPPLLSERGFVKRPVALRQWEDAVSVICWPDNATFFFEDVSVFTDGSTVNAGSVPKAAWSCDFTVVQTGPLPGRQTN